MLEEKKKRKRGKQTYLPSSGPSSLRGKEPSHHTTPLPSCHTTFAMPSNLRGGNNSYQKDQSYDASLPSIDKYADELRDNLEELLTLLLPRTSLLTAPPVKPPKGAKKSGMLKDLNDNNIIEGGRTQRGAYAVALKDATTSLNAYHTAFAAFILSQLFYSAVLATTATKKVEQSEPLRMHCDYLSAELDN